MKNRSTTRIVAIILTLTLGVVLYWGFTALFRPVPVVILTNEVPTGQLIKKSDVMLDKVSLRDRSAEAFTSIAAITGAGDSPGLYAATDLFPGQQLIQKQTTDNPDKLRNALAGIHTDQTVLQLTSAQASWPDILRDGDFVMIQAVYKDKPDADNIGVGRITKNLSAPAAGGFSQITQGSSSGGQVKQYIVCSISTEENALSALANADMIYLRPMHPQLGRKGL